MKKQIKKALVLGGAGFIGKYLLDILLEKEIDVQCLVNKSPLHTASKKVEVFHGSLSDFNWEQLEPALPDVIFHTARMSGTSQKSRLEAALKNAEANQRLIEWLGTLKHPPLLIYVSGTLVYGSHGQKQVDESESLNPISFQREYFLAEEPVLSALEDKKLPVLVARPCWIYGPGSWLDAFYLNPFVSRKAVPLYGKGNNLMSFIHVKDCAGMINHLAMKGCPGNVYNLFSHKAIKQKDFVKILANILGGGMQKMPSLWMRLRFGKVVSEAFHFSLNLTTKHGDCFENYSSFYPDLKEGLKAVIDDAKPKND